MEQNIYKDRLENSLLLDTYRQLLQRNVNMLIVFLSTAINLYGIKTASAIFQRTIEQVIGDDIANIVYYQDDICIRARNEIELKKKTEIVFLRRLRNTGLKINKKICT